ncbi:MAG: redoxin domain-containing protein [Bacteroidales bacterium]|nr:redoxin domain-containing protein [Bacteroidales bacterium]
MNNRFIKVVFGSVAVGMLALMAGCSRLPNTKLQILLPEGVKSARIQVVDFKLDTNVAAVNNVVTFAVPSNPAVSGTVSLGKGFGAKGCTFIPDGTALTVDMTGSKPALSSDKKSSINYRMLANKDFEMQSASDYSRKVQDARGRADLSPEARDSIVTVATQDFQKLVLDEYRKRAEQEKDNYIGADAILKLRGKIPNEELDSLISTMSPAVIASGTVSTVRDNIRALMATDEGMPFKDFTVKDGKKEIRLSDYVGKGKYVLVDFWASWSRPCDAERAFIKEAYDRFEGDRFMVLGVAVWDEPESTMAAVVNRHIPWTCIHDATEAARIYGVITLPHVILFGPDGKIIRRGLTGEDIVKTVDFYLK